MKTFRIAMLGFGVAGQAFSKILLEKKDEIARDTGYEVLVSAICTGSHGCLTDPAGIDLAQALHEYGRDGRFDPVRADYSTWNSLEVAERAEYDALLEMTPINIRTGQPALDHLRIAMNRGKHAISANKGPLAYAYDELCALAKKNGVRFLYETTVMAGTPLFNMTEDCLAYCTISKVEGILNATTNYVLEEMGKGVPWDTIMENGRRGGFMEADASNDLEGWDAAVKLTTLLNVLMHAGITPADVDRTGIMQVTAADIAEAAGRGNKIKLLCRGERTEDGKVAASVKPVELPSDDAMAGGDVVASVKLYTDFLGPMTINQYGIEPSITGYGLFIDLIRILRGGSATLR